MKKYHRGSVSIDMNAIEHNINEIVGNLNDSTSIMLVVKADGYGHGAEFIAKSYDSNNRIWGFGVASLEEGILLRSVGVTKPILVLGMVFRDQYEDAIVNNISLNVFTKDMVDDLVEIAKKNDDTIKIHIKLDTGMSRLGAKCDEETVEWISDLSKNKSLELEGVFTHFATADESDKSFTQLQYDEYLKVVDSLKNKGVTIKNYHCGNSATAIDLPTYGMNLLRVGIALYGLYPSREVSTGDVKLLPALSWNTVVSCVRTIEAGDTVSYGRTFTAYNGMRIATIPIGYADGYPRSLSNSGYVLIYGERAKILGKVCMDQFMVDVSHIKNVEYMTSVTLIGYNGKSSIEVEELSDISGKFNYEFVCGIGKRIPRNYIKDGKVVEQRDYFA